MNLKSAQLIVDANNGNAEAQYRYALILWRDTAARNFEEAQEIKRNDEEALLQLTHAAEAGLPEAIKALNRIKNDNEKIKNKEREDKARDEQIKIREKLQKQETILNAVQQIEIILIETGQQINVRMAQKKEIGDIIQAWFTSLNTVKDSYKAKLNTESEGRCDGEKIKGASILFKQDCEAITKDAQEKLQALIPDLIVSDLKWYDYLMDVSKRVINCIIRFCTSGRTPHFFALKVPASSQVVIEGVVPSPPNTQNDLEDVNTLLVNTKSKLGEIDINTNDYPWMMECCLPVFLRSRLSSISEDTEEDVYHDTFISW